MLGSTVNQPEAIALAFSLLSIVRIPASFWSSSKEALTGFPARASFFLVM
jgi:hypothetical protein